MALEFNSAVTAAIEANLVAAAAKFPDPGLTWSWSTTSDDTAVEYIADVVGAQNGLELRIRIPFGTALAQLYSNDAIRIYYRSTTTSGSVPTVYEIDTTQPTEAERQGFSTFSDVLDFVAAYTAVFAATP